MPLRRIPAAATAASAATPPAPAGRSPRVAEAARGAAPRRRSVVTAVALLGAGAVPLLTSGCTGGPDDSGDGATGGPEEHSEEAQQLRTAEAGRRRELLDRYDGTVAAHAVLAERLKPLRAAVAQQAAALEGDDGKGRKRSGGKGTADVPSKEKDALAALAEAEQQAADRHTAALSGAPPELARLLASVAAAGAAHAVLLGDGSGTDGATDGGKDGKA